MGRQFITQAAKATRAAVRRLLTQLAYLADERIDLLLLLKDGLVELLYQVFGEAGFDFKLHQALVYVGVRHVCRVLFQFILVSSARNSSNWSL
jgi:hypothetical protein